MNAIFKFPNRLSINSKTFQKFRSIRTKTGRSLDSMVLSMTDDSCSAARLLWNSMKR